MIVRSPRKTRFTTVLNTFIEDGRLSLKAKGLLLFILSKPDGWHITVRGLISLPELGTDGRDAVVSALQELETCGYLHRTRIRRANGTWEWISTITEEPEDHDGESAQNPAEYAGDHDGKPETDGESAQNPAKYTGDHDGKPENDDDKDTSTMTENPHTMYGLSVHGKPVQIINTDQANIPSLSAKADNKGGGASPSLALQVNAAMLAVHNAKNKVAALGDLHLLCFGFEPDYARLGALAKKFSATAVALQFVNLVSRPPADPLAYTQGVLENERKRKATQANGGTEKGAGGVLGKSAQHSGGTVGRGQSAACNARPTATFVEIDD